MNCLKARRADSRLERIGKNESVTRLGELTGYLWRRRTKERREKKEEKRKKRIRGRSTIWEHAISLTFSINKVYVARAAFAEMKSTSYQSM